MRCPRPLAHLPSPSISFSSPHHLSSPPSPSSVAAIYLNSCSNPSQLSQIHAFLLRHDLLLLSFHWNSLMRCYLRFSLPSSSLRLFILMSRAGVFADHYSLPIALKAAFTSFTFSAGVQLHSIAVKNGLSRHEFSESALICLYAKAGDFVPAHQLFDENPQRKLGSWNALISSYAQAGHCFKAIDLFIHLRRIGEVADDMTVVSAASACGGLGDILLAEQIHGCVVQAQTTLDTRLSNSLIDMYGKCGRTDAAFKVFDGMPERDVSSWTAMIMGLATQGNPIFALELFARMKEVGGVEANDVTMVAVLCACANAGMWEEVERVRRLMRDRKVGKIPGFSLQDRCL